MYSNARASPEMPDSQQAMDWINEIDASDIHYLDPDMAQYVLRRNPDLVQRVVNLPIVRETATDLAALDSFAAQLSSDASEASQMGAAIMPEVSPGSRVRVHGPDVDCKIRGTVGMIASFQARMGRWQVVLANGEQVLLRTQDIQLVRDDEIVKAADAQSNTPRRRPVGGFEPGSLVRVRKSHAELAGSTGSLHSYNSDKNGWLVMLDSGQARYVDPKNLEIAPDKVEATPPETKPTETKHTSGLQKGFLWKKEKKKENSIVVEPKQTGHIPRVATQVSRDKSHEVEAEIAERVKPQRFELGGGTRGVNVVVSIKERGNAAGRTKTLFCDAVNSGAAMLWEAIDHDSDRAVLLGLRRLQAKVGTILAYLNEIVQFMYADTAMKHFQSLVGFFHGNWGLHSIVSRSLDMTLPEKRAIIIFESSNGVLRNILQYIKKLLECAVLTMQEDKEWVRASLAEVQKVLFPPPFPRLPSLEGLESTVHPLHRMTLKIKVYGSSDEKEVVFDRRWAVADLAVWLSELLGLESPEDLELSSADGTNEAEPLAWNHKLRMICNPVAVFWPEQSVNWPPVEKIFKLTPVTATRMLVELRSCFQEPGFINRYYQLRQKAERGESAAFQKQVHDKLADMRLSVETTVASKYGFEASASGVEAMRSEIAYFTDPAEGDATVSNLSYECSGILEGDQIVPIQTEANKHNDENQKDPDRRSRKEWEALERECEGLAQLHAAQTPRERRAYSWSRTLAFAQVILGRKAVELRKGTMEKPFVIWVLGAHKEVEVNLAEQGFMSDVNWIDRCPVEVIFLGDDLHSLKPEKSPVPKTNLPTLRTACYSGLLELPQPDLLASFMPDSLPEALVAKAGTAPVVVTSRFRIADSVLKNAGYSNRLIPQTRSPFSAAAGDSCAEYDDNGWFFAVRGTKGLGAVLPLKAHSEPALQTKSDEKLPAVFWGIIDLKYDDTLPILNRVQVLETGDGRTSKFSGAGTALPARMRSKYKMEDTPTLRKYAVVSADKKLTHDLMEIAGYGHIIPQQACFPRQYESDLASRISDALHVGPEENVVLKLCNRSRAAGVLVTPVSELDQMLQQILRPPSNLRQWFQQGLQGLQESASNVGVEYASFEEQVRHWWSNEGPSFVAEKCCTSTPTMLDGKPFDGTMRVGFVLHRRPNATQDVNGVPPPQDLQVEWLGGYWKLPKHDVSSTALRERVISAARTFGTASVSPQHLTEVYAALGDAMQQLFGGPEPSADLLARWYTDQPALGAYLTARLGMKSSEEPVKAYRTLGIAEKKAKEMQDGPARRCVESFVGRGRGILEVKSHPNERRWDTARTYFAGSVGLLPTSANALYCLGVAIMELGRTEEATMLLNKSLLLDPDFKGPYVNLGAAYLRLKNFKAAAQISEAGLARHPQTPQFYYHAAVGYCQMALQLEASCQSFDKLPAAVLEEYDSLVKKSYDGMRKARSFEEADRRRPEKVRVLESPWLEEDFQMLEAMEVSLRPREQGSPTRDDSERIELPPHVGWQHFSWRV